MQRIRLNWIFSASKTISVLYHVCTRTGHWGCCFRHKDFPDFISYIKIFSSVSLSEKSAQCNRQSRIEQQQEIEVTLYNYLSLCGYLLLFLMLLLTKNRSFMFWVLILRYSICCISWIKYWRTKRAKARNFPLNCCRQWGCGFIHRSLAEILIAWVFS